MFAYYNTGILKRFIYTFLILFFIVSCDCMYDYTYEVTNNSDSNIKIDLTIDYKTFKLDSVFNVNQNETKKLFITDHFIEGCNGPYFLDVSFDLDKFIVSKNDTIFSKKNYLENSSWQYANGFYRTTITNEEFQ